MRINVLRKQSLHKHCCATLSTMHGYIALVYTAHKKRLIYRQMQSYLLNIFSWLFNLTMVPAFSFLAPLASKLGIASLVGTTFETLHVLRKLLNLARRADPVPLSD